MLVEITNVRGRIPNVKISVLQISKKPQLFVVSLGKRPAGTEAKLLFAVETDC
jgi:hypothetical protein